MSEWKTVRLGDLCSKIGSGATPAGGKSAYCDEGISLIRSQNVLDMSFSVDGLAHINDTQAKKLDGVTVREGDVLLNITGDSVARCCSVPSYVLPARVNQHVCIIRASAASPKYIEYYLISIKQHLLTLAAAGATRNALTKETIQNLEIQLPDLPTQRRIAAVLGALDDKIENNRKICENLEAQAQALFKSWFVDFEPWGGKMPEGWKKGKLRDIAGYDNRRIAASSLTVETYFSTENMLPDRGGVTAASSIPQSGEVPLCEEGSVLVSNIRPYFKKIYRATETAGHSADVLCFEAKDSSLQWYLYRLLWGDAFFAYVMSGAKGCKMPRGDKEQILDYGCVIPGADNVAEFNAVVEPMCQRITHCNKESRALAEMRDALLPKLMSGEIDVEKVAI